MDESLAAHQPTALPLTPGPSVAAMPAAGESAPAVMDERAIIVLTSVGHAVCHIGELVFTGAVFAIMREFSLEPHQATALALFGYILMGVGALPVGLWADAWGPTRVLYIYFLAMAVSCVAVAVAPTPLLLFVALTGLGLAASIYHPAGVAMLSLGVRARGRAMGINGVAGSIGVAVGPLLGMLADAMGMWRLAYLVVAAIAVASAVVMRIKLKGQYQFAFSHNVKAMSKHSPAQTASPPKSLKNYWPLAFLFAAMMLGGFNYRCLVTALPPFLSGESAAGSSLVKSGLWVSLALVVGGVGQFFGGWLADAFGSRRIYLIAIHLLAILALLLGYLEGSPYAVVVACFLAISLFAQQPVENGLVAEWTTTGRRSVSYGAKFALTFGVGALGVQAVGLIWHESNSVAGAFHLLAASATLMGILFLASVFTRKA